MDIWGSMSLQINQILFSCICCLSDSIRFFLQTGMLMSTPSPMMMKTLRRLRYTNPFVSLKNDVIDIINCIIKFNLTNNALIVIDY